MKKKVVCVNTNISKLMFGCCTVQLLNVLLLVGLFREEKDSMLKEGKKERKKKKERKILIKITIQNRTAGKNLQ